MVDERHAVMCELIGVAQMYVEGTTLSHRYVTLVAEAGNAILRGEYKLAGELLKLACDTF